MDADARRTRAIARLARLWWLTDLVFRGESRFGRANYRAWYAAVRLSGVERVARRDVLAGYTAVHFPVPARNVRNHHHAVAYYHHAAHLAAGQPGEAVQAAGPRRPVRRDRPGR